MLRMKISLTRFLFGDGSGVTTIVADRAVTPPLFDGSKLN